jgi:UDP-N-acetylglucosamine--N-acetylmuramyl-(pentapeptide) pyrophosphoryl-undecaprenol N-acetylglucosamine transferase
MTIVKSVLVMAGGTGGHVFPALAVARALQAQGVSIHWLGTARGIEADVVPKAGIAISYLNVGGLRGNGLLPLLQAPFKLVFAVWQTMAICNRVQADAVIGLGGYVTGPGGVAARMLGLPLYIHEQNAVAGLTNKILARIATRILQAFPSAFAASAKVSTVGNPIRADIAALPVPALRYSSRQGPLQMLVLGGSLGAVALNQLVPQALAELAVEQRPIIRHQAGRKHAANAQATYAGLGVDATVLPFIDDMAAEYAWADVVICRSGALTVSEIAAAGVASVLIPFPHAVDDHQTVNARYLSDAGAALLFQQKDLTVSMLASTLRGLLVREHLQAMAEKARTLAETEATTRVVQMILRGEA